MENPILKRFILVFAITTLTAWPAVSQSADGSERTIEVGFEQRVRNENWNNLLDFNDKTDDQRNQIRYRTRLWSDFQLSDKVNFKVGLDQETNQIIVPRQPWKFDEIVFESLYLDFHDVLTKGLSLRIGRQNLMKGEGWLFIEGDPWDGSRSVYSNAFDLTYSHGKTKYEAIGVWNPAKDRFLPRIHPTYRQLIEWDEQAIGAYVTHALNKNTDLETYYFLKKEYHDCRPVTNPQFQPDRHVNTAGGRLVRRFGSGWNWTSEGDGQWGADNRGTDIRAWGGYSHLRKTIAGPRKLYLQGGWYGFSGDDPNTSSVYGGFDPLFSRWPAWSELYIYTQLKEKGVAYWTNLSMWQAETAFSPWKNANWRFTYYRMDSFYPFHGSAALYGTGTGRGNMFQSRLDFALNEQWRGHVLYEGMLPGSFYAHDAPAYFLRFEAIYAFKHAFKTK